MPVGSFFQALTKMHFSRRIITFDNIESRKVAILSNQGISAALKGLAESCRIRQGSNERKAICLDRRD